MAAFFGDWQKVFLMLGVFSGLLAIAIFVLVKDKPEDMGCPTIPEIEAYEKGERYIPPKAVEKIPMGEALRQTFSSGMKFWPLSIWFFFMYGSLMVYQGLRITSYNVCYTKLLRTGSSMHGPQTVLVSGI